MKQNNFFRVLTVILIAVLMLGCMSAPAYAAVTKKEAQKIARQYVPAKSKLVETEWSKKSKTWEFEFLTQNKKQEYEVTVAKATGKVKKVEMELRNVRKATKYSIKKAAAKEALLAAFPDAANITIKKVTDEGSKIYKITFTTSEYKGEVKVHGETGKIIEWEKKYK